MKKLALSVLIGLFITWMTVRYWPVAVHIQGTSPADSFFIQMPLKDKKRLEYFFRDVCFAHEWAYTFIGSKPMSVYHYANPYTAIRRVVLHPKIKDILLETFVPPRLDLICYLFNPEQLRLKLGWDTLHKYMNRFPNSRFVLFSRPTDVGTVGLVLVDKVKMILFVKQHLPDFQEKLKSLSIGIDDLADDENLYSFIFSLNDDYLVGSVLGYGRNNALLFDRCNKMNLAEWPLVSPWSEEEEENFAKLNQKQITSEPWDLSDLFYPRFVCDPGSEETNLLKQTYQQERKEIIKYYQGKDVVEATLSLFIINPVQ